MNGDGLPDYVDKAGGRDIYVYINTGNFELSHYPWSPDPWAENAFETTPVWFGAGLLDETYVSSGTGSWSGETLMDVNGDGLPDRVLSYNGLPGQFIVRLNDGQRFGTTPGVDEFILTAPYYEIRHPSIIHPQARAVHLYNNDNIRSTISDFADVNADGFPDYIMSDGSEWRFLLNQGGVQLEPLPGGQAGTDIFDIPRAWEGVGAFIRETIDQDHNNRYSLIDIVDFNGDGFLDHVRVDGNNLWHVRNGQPADTEGRVAPPHRLVKYHNGLGSVTEVRYEPSRQFDNTDASGLSQMPFNLWVVTGIRQTDGLCVPDPDWNLFKPSENGCLQQGHETLKRYWYHGGYYDEEEAAFRGFRRVHVIDPHGNQEVNLFLQTDELQGRRELVEIHVHGHETPIRVEQFDWRIQPSALGGDRSQVFLRNHTIINEDFPSYDTANRSCLINRNEPPDVFGRIPHSCSYDCGNAPPVEQGCGPAVAGKLETLTTWADPGGSTGQEVRNRAAQTTTRWVDGQVVSHVLKTNQYYYDDQPLGVVEVGSLTETRVVGGSAGDSVVRNEWDAYGNITRTTDGDGYSTEFVFTDDRHFYLVHDREVRPTTANGVLHQVAQEIDLRIGKAVSTTDENGQVTEYRYDSVGREICRVLPGDSTAGCDPAASPSATRRMAYRYPLSQDPAAPLEDRLTRVTMRRLEPNHPDGESTAESYLDGLGRARFAIEERVIGNDPLPQPVVSDHTRYNAQGRTSVHYAPYRYPAGGVTIVPAVDPGATVREYDLNGVAASDPRGRVHRERLPDGSETRTFYRGTLRITQNPKGGEVHERRNHLGFVVLEEQLTATPEIRVAYERDGLNRVLAREVVGHPETRVEHDYDLLGREVERREPDAAYPWRFGYDLRGNVIYRDDPKPGQQVQTCYDALGRIKRRLMIENTDDFLPDACATLSGPPGVTVTVESEYEYDSGQYAIGRLVSVSDLSGTETNSYDARGRVLVSEKAVTGQPITSTSYQYDAVGHVTQVTYPDDEVVAYGYNAIGEVATVGSLLTGIEYDHRGRMEAIYYGNEVSDYRTYHGAAENYALQDHMIVHEPAGGSVTRHYDATHADYNGLGQLKQVVDNRDPAEALSVGALYQYDAQGRLARVDWDYKEQPNAPPVVDTFFYDEIGNMTEKDAELLVYDQLGPHQVGRRGAFSYTYDANGSRTQKIHDDGARQSYHYNALGRLTQINLEPDSTTLQTVRHVYDHRGERVKEVVDGATERVYFGRHYMLQGNTLTKYYFAGDLRIAARQVDLSQAQLQHGYHVPLDLRVLPAAAPWLGGAALVGLVLVGGRSRPGRLGGVVSPARAAATGVAVGCLTPALLTGGCGGGSVLRYYHVDRLGSTVAISNGAGTLVRQVRYDAYGEVRDRFTGAGAPGATPLQHMKHEFTGYETEFLSGLAYAGARFYDPETGMFLSQDPARQFLSPYAYGPGDPINGTDPTGTSFIVGLLVAVAVSVIFSVVRGVIATQGMSTNDRLAAIFKGAAVSAVTTTIGFGLGAAIISGTAAPLQANLQSAMFSLGAAKAAYDGANGDILAPIEFAVGLAAGAMVAARSSGAGDNAASGKPAKGGGSGGQASQSGQGFSETHAAEPGVQVAGAFDDDIAAFPGRALVKLNNDSINAQLDQRIADLRAQARAGDFGGLDVAAFKVRTIAPVHDLGVNRIVSGSVHTVAKPPGTEGFPHAFAPRSFISPVGTFTTVSNPIFIHSARPMMLFPSLNLPGGRR